VSCLQTSFFWYNIVYPLHPKRYLKASDKRLKSHLAVQYTEKGHLAGLLKGSWSDPTLNRFYAIPQLSDKMPSAFQRPAKWQHMERWIPTIQGYPGQLCKSQTAASPRENQRTEDD